MLLFSDIFSCKAFKSDIFEKMADMFFQDVFKVRLRQNFNSRITICFPHEPKTLLKKFHFSVLFE